MSDSDMIRIEVGLSVATDPPAELRTIARIHKARWEQMDWEQQTAWMEQAKRTFVDSAVTAWAQPLDESEDA